MPLKPFSVLRKLQKTRASEALVFFCFASLIVYLHFDPIQIEEDVQIGSWRMFERMGQGVCKIRIYSDDQVIQKNFSSLFGNLVKDEHEKIIVYGKNLSTIQKNKMCDMARRENMENVSYAISCLENGQWLEASSKKVFLKCF